MFDSVPAFIHSNLPFLAIILCAVIAAAVSYFLYRRSVPPLPLSWRIALAVIRGMAIALILILFFNPELILIWQRKIPVKIGIAVDRSASMKLEDRIEKAQKVVRLMKDDLKGRAELQVFTFDTDTGSTDGDQVTVSDRATDISSSLAKIADSEFKPDALILISDGNFTTGQNPVYSPAPRRIKIFTVGVGDTAPAPDLIVTDVQTEKIIYQGQLTTVKAGIQLSGLTETRANVIFLKGEKEITARQIKIDQKDVIIPVRFDLKPDQLGLVRYRIRIDPLAEEKNIDNNEYSFSLNVLKGKLNIGLVAAKPGLDLKFLKLILDEREDLNTRLYLTGDRFSGFRQSSLLRSDTLDLLTLVGIPPAGVQDLLSAQINQNRYPLLVFVNDIPDGTGLNFLQSISAVRSVTRSEKVEEYLIQPTAEGRSWPVMNIYTDELTNNTFWSLYPPIHYPFKKIELITGAVSVLETRSETPAPVMYKYAKAGQRAVVFFGSGFWRWHFLLAENVQFNHTWSEQIYNVVRWLTSAEAYNNVILTLQKAEYQSGEPIRLNIQVFDGSLNPITDATVRIKISGAGQDYEVEGRLNEDSVYLGELPSPGTGTYTIQAQAWRNDVRIGTASREILVSPVNAEFLSTRQDYRLLQSLARVSGAVYVSADSAGKLQSYFDLTPRVRRVERTIELWYKLPLLLLILILFTIEWFIRKRKGLA